MNKKFLHQFVPKIAAIIIAAACAVTVSYADSVWTKPSAIAPAGNREGFINVGSTDQVKTGPLSVGGIFMVGQNAQIDGTATINDIFGHSNGNFYIGGKNASGKVDRDTNVMISHDLAVAGTMQSDTLAGVGDNTPLCVTATGSIYACKSTPPAARDVCSNVSGIQTSVPAGYYYAPNSGNCYAVPKITSVAFDPAGTDVQVCGNQKGTISCTADTTNRKYSLDIQLDNPLLEDVTVQVRYAYMWQGFKDHIFKMSSIDFQGTKGSTSITGSQVIGAYMMVPESMRAYCMVVVSPASSVTPVLDTVPKYSTINFVSGANGSNALIKAPYSYALPDCSK